MDGIRCLTRRSPCPNPTHRRRRVARWTMLTGVVGMTGDEADGVFEVVAESFGPAMLGRGPANQEAEDKHGRDEFGLAWIFRLRVSTTSW